MTPAESRAGSTPVIYLFLLSGIDMNVYELNQLASGIKVGDKVKVTREAESRERNWPFPWVPSMHTTVGKVGIVESITLNGIIVTFGSSHRSAYYPYFVLEVVE